MDALVAQFLDVDIMVSAWPLLLRGLGTTLLICLAVIPLGLAGGLLAALGSLAPSRALRWSTIALVDLFRAIPPLVLLIFVYAGLPFAGLDIEPFTAVVVAFFLNNTAYYGEVFRAGILSVGTGQNEAARSSGLNAVPGARARGAAAGRAQRAAGSPVEHGRGGQADLARLRRLARRAACTAPTWRAR